MQRQEWREKLVWLGPKVEAASSIVHKSTDREEEEEEEKGKVITHSSAFILSKTKFSQ